MYQPDIGTYVMLQDTLPQAPRWPALVCPDEFGNDKIARERPSAFHFLAMVIKDIPQCTWARWEDAKDFDPFPNEEIVRNHQGLQRAYALTLAALQSEQDAVEYWRDFMHKKMNTITINDSDSDDGDIKLKKTIRMSLSEHKHHQPSGLLTPSPTPFESTAKRDIRHLLAQKDPSDSSTVRNGKRPRIDNGDIVDGDLADSKVFVEFLVGSEQQSFLIPKKAVSDRHYFSNPHLGYLRLKGDIKDGQGWTIDIPSLQDIDARPFSYIAQYLENNEFGTTRITDENRSAAFVECVEAWEIADKLAMHDLLEHIVAKLFQLTPWDAAHVLSFASIVYKEKEKALLKEQEALKVMLSDFIINQYYEIGMVYGVEFIRRLHELPELAEVVHMKVAYRDSLRKRENEENYRDGHCEDGDGR